jgi:hypothetical protein
MREKGKKGSNRCTRIEEGRRKEKRNRRAKSQGETKG